MLREEGQSRWQASDWDTVIRALEELIRLGDDDAELNDKLYSAYVNRGTDAVQGGNKQRALSDWQRALEVKPSGGEARAALIQLTPTPTPPPTSTPTLEQSYPALDPRELRKNPERYRGEKFRISGEIFRIQESGLTTYFQMWANVPGGDRWDRVPVTVVFRNTMEGAYEGSSVTVYGAGAGTMSGTNAFGARIEQPLVSADRAGWSKR